MGYVILIGLIDPDCSVEFKRIVIEPKGYGFGRQTICLVKELVFNKLKAHRLWLEVLSDNTRAYNLYLSEGFTEEGIHRESLKQGDVFLNLRVMSILVSEYRLTQ